jgi:hypothetical protein
MFIQAASHASNTRLAQISQLLLLLAVHTMETAHAALKICCSHNHHQKICHVTGL